MSFGRLVTTLLEDSNKSLIFARDELQKGNESLSSYYIRSVFFISWSALEGWINYASHSFASTDRTLTEFEVAFLKEKRIEIDDDGLLKITNQDAYEPTLKKLLYILQKFGNGFDLRHSMPDLWRELKEVESKRHALVHPKNREIEIQLDIADAEKCFNTIRNTIEIVKTKIYGPKSLWPQKPPDKRLAEVLMVFP